MQILIGKEACNSHKQGPLINLEGPEIKHFIPHQIQNFLRQGGMQTPKNHKFL